MKNTFILLALIFAVKSIELDYISNYYKNNNIMLN
jgi:hypothetical protein